MKFKTREESTKLSAYQEFSAEFEYYIGFFQNFSELLSYNGRIISFIGYKNIHHLDTSLIDSSVQTLKSIQLCCSIGCFSDANTLIRKLRDDLILYIFILDVINHRKPFVEEDIGALNLADAESFASSFSKVRFNKVLTEDEQAVEAWFDNSVSDLPYSIKKKLSFENYMKLLQRNEHISTILSEYKLQSYWDQLRKRLNNYVHNNGKQFTRQNLISTDNKNIETFLKNITIRTSYISSFFIVSLLMVESALISSTDMIDYLDNDMRPPDECQFQIAPFVQEFIDTRVATLHPELKEYLNNNNNYGMKIE